MTLIICVTRFRIYKITCPPQDKNLWREGTSVKQLPQIPFPGCFWDEEICIAFYSMNLLLPCLRFWTVLNQQRLWLMDLIMGILYRLKISCHRPFFQPSPSPPCKKHSFVSCNSSSRPNSMHISSPEQVGKLCLFVECCCGAYHPYCSCPRLKNR
jgi:hypothetical protein